MLTLDAVQTALVASDNKTGRWAFHISDANGVGYSYYTDAIGADGWATDEAWGTGEAWFDGTGNNTVVLMEFSGIELRRNASEVGIIAPSEVTFSLSNPNNILDFTNFKGGTVLIELFLWNPTYGEHKITGWKFNIKTCEPGYQKLNFTCEDFLQDYLRGYYPNTRLPEDIFPSNRTYVGNMICVPVPFGSVYVPLRDVFITNAGYLMLGDPTHTYTVGKIRSPRSVGMKSEWDYASFAFNQSTKADAGAVNWRVFQAIIADSDNNGIVDAHGFWGTPGGPILDPPVLFSRDDTVSITNPADVINYVLQDMGIPSSNIDATSFAAAHIIFDNYIIPLTFNGAFWYKQDRQKALSQLLTMCHSCLDIGETIKMRVLVKTSRATITGADVMRTSEQGPGTFSYRDIINEDLSDSGYIAYQETGEAQDELHKILVSTGGTATIISSEVIECPFVQNVLNVKRIGTLHWQRKLGKVAGVGWLNKSTGTALQPDDLITINGSNYGGSYDVIIDSMKISKEGSIQFQCTKFKQAISDWEDLSPTSYSIPVDDTTHPWSAVITGPDSPGVPIPLNAIADRLRVGNGAADYILIEPATPRVSLYNSGEKYRFGNLNGYLGVSSDLFGFGAGVATAGYANLIYDTTNGLRLRSGTTNVVNIDNAGNITISGGISASTIDIGGADATSFHVDIDGNMWLGAATFNIATNPFAVSNAGVLRAVSGTIGGWTLATDRLYAGTDADFIQFNIAQGIQIGDSTFADAKFSVTPAGVLKAISGTIGGCALAVSSIGSTTFVPGPLGSGWNISNAGTAEFQNVTIRGTIRTSVFEKDTISAVNGMVLISKADILATDMTALDASTLTISGETTFVANEVIRIKDGIDDEWMLVTNAAAAPTYTVTRDLAAAYGANANPIWKKGTAVISMGVGTGTKTGFVLLDSSSANSPYIDIYGRNSNTYTDYTLHARLGWLQGIVDADVGLNTTDVWGLYSDSVYLKGVIVANTGYIGGTSGWVIAAGKITSTGVGVATAAGDATYAFWAGDNTPANAEFSVTHAGALKATSATIAGDITATSGYFTTVTLGKTGVASGTLTLQINDTGGDTFINSGKNDFTNTDAGFILGLDDSDSNKVKFYMGSSTKYLNWDGTSITILGDIKTAASGERLEFLTSDNKLHFYNSGGTEIITIGEADTNPLSGSIYINDTAARTADVTMFWGARAGTVNTTDTAVNNYGMFGQATTTRSAGAYNCINVGIVGNASGGQLNYGGYFYGTTAAVVADGHVFPVEDNTKDLGSSSLRWQNIYTGDLHLSNERGDWTIKEGEDQLFLINNKTKKSYSINMTEITGA